MTSTSEVPHTAAKTAKTNKVTCINEGRGFNPTARDGEHRLLSAVFGNYSAGRQFEQEVFAGKARLSEPLISNDQLVVDIKYTECADGDARKVLLALARFFKPELGYLATLESTNLLAKICDLTKPALRKAVMQLRQMNLAAVGTTFEPTYTVNAGMIHDVAEGMRRVLARSNSAK